MCRYVSLWAFRNRVCPYPEKRNHPSFVNISTAAWKPKNWIFFSKKAELEFWLVLKSQYFRQHQSYTSDWYMIGEVFMSTATLTGLLSHVIQSINIQLSSRSQHISVLTACTFMFRQVFIIEPSFFSTTWGMHRRLIDDRHLVFLYIS